MTMWKPEVALPPPDRTEDAPRSVAVIDDHDIVRYGLEAVLLQSSALRLVGSAATLWQGIEMIHAQRPDLVVTDMMLPDSQGTRTIRMVVEAQRGRRVLVMSMQDEMLYGEAALGAGAHGYLQKERAREHLIEAATALLAGDNWTSPALRSRLLDRLLQRKGPGAAPGARRLTPRELEVLEQLKTGRTTKEIAANLRLSARTVDLYRASIKRKLRLRTGAELMAYAFHTL